MPTPRFKPVPSSIDFPRDEAEVLAFWKDAGIFEKSLAARDGAERWVFFEGPPTANGTPHNGHVLTRVIKDLFPRYKTMRGYRVDRKAGWDTHGLPVEVEVEKSLGIHGKGEIVAYGVEDFTKRCIESVFKYTDVWEQLTERIGFWVNLDEAYVTFHKPYVESVWWALKTLFDKGLLYQGHKVVWWWPQGGTALSSGEVGQGYKTVDDPAITVKFPIDGEPGCFFLSWTTTPWTLPSNVALSVRSDLTYAYARVTETGETYVLERTLCDGVLGEGAYEIVKDVPGAQLVGKTYQPPFRAADPEDGDAWRVIHADFVTADATGIVHTAPAFGEDDFKAGKDAGVGIINLVKPDGTFDERMGDLAGVFVKKADRPIIRDLKARGLLFKEAVYRHDYPFCWRADEDPLIQYARPAWFIRTTDVIDRAIQSNQQIRWAPEHIKDGRFGDFLRNNVDWALSRERFWGTPLPIWICEACETHEAFDSVAAIEARNPNAFDHFRQAKADDPSLSDHLAVHKPWVDEVTVPCAQCEGTMRRVPEVIDCWFDSGCMPFAQWGYPHQGQQAFADNWPADFISEAIDQTRGWFYSLLMVSTLLFEDADKPHPYRSCIVLGHVADKHGKKESKSKGNYTPPDAILDRDGADAMRWYFYAANPPWNSTRYSPDAVRQGQQEFLVKLRNSFAFFTIYANIDGFDPTDTERFPKRSREARGRLDRWMLSELALTVRDVTEAMDAYGIYDAAQRIVRLTDALSNWWIRRSRDRFWSGLAGDADRLQAKWDAFHTLYEVLTTLSKVAAPFVPFISETLYQNLERGLHGGSVPESIHLCDWPEVDAAAIDEALSEEMQAVRDIVSLGLSTRASHKLKVRQPLGRAEIVLGHATLVERLSAYVGLIADELNVKAVEFTQDADDVVTFQVKPNYRALGPVFGKRMPVIRKALDGADAESVRRALAEGGEFALTLPDGEVVTLTPDHVQVAVEAKDGFAASGGPVGVVALDTTLTDALVAEGRAREVVSRLQAIRKDRDLAYTDRLAITLHAPPELAAACEAHKDAIAAEVLATRLDVVAVDGAGAGAGDALADVDGLSLRAEVAVSEG